MLDNLGLTEPSPLSVTTLLINLFLAAVFAYILSWHYIHFGKTYSNRLELAQVFPLIILTTVLIISVVKSSLALSLGLVGALSIVRFRTPIKEPEELGYIFMAISIGLGFGADQRIPTLVGSLVIMGILSLMMSVRQSHREAKHNLYLNVEVPKHNGKASEDRVFEQIHDILSTYTSLTDMRRLDARNGVIQATYYINCRDSKTLIDLMDNLQATMPEAAISFVEQKGILRN